jgi:hypothetical protein
MSDSVKKWYEDREEDSCNPRSVETRCFLWVLDFESAQTHLYNVRRNLTDEDYEKLLEIHGHNVKSCKYMVTERDKIYN